MALEADATPLLESLDIHKERKEMHIHSPLLPFAVACTCQPPFSLSLFKYKLGLTTWVVSAEANT
jgi:hypothetical protein